MKMNSENMSLELRAGIARYYATTAPYRGRLVRALVKGILREGTFIELGAGGCQPGLITADGRRWRIDAIESIQVVA